MDIAILITFSGISGAKKRSAYLAEDNLENGMFVEAIDAEWIEFGIARCTFDGDLRVRQRTVKV